MASITRTSFSTGDIPSASEWNTQFDTVYNRVNTYDDGTGTIDVTSLTAGNLTFSGNSAGTSTGNFEFTALVQKKVTSGITASTTQTQGQGALTSDINEISTCANHKDTVTLPAAVAGQSVTVVNKGANILQIFPASGDDLGNGADTSMYIAVGELVTFKAYDSTNYVPVFTSMKWTSFTPTVVSCGTVSNNAAYYSKEGDTMHIHGAFTSGTCTATEFQIPLPDGWQIDSNYSSIAPTNVGRLDMDTSTRQYALMLATASDTFVNGGTISATADTNRLVPANGSSLIFNSTDCTYRFSVRVTAS